MAPDSQSAAAANAEFELSGAFFTPGHTALACLESVVSLAADGHEIGHHGWVQEALTK